MAKVASIGAVPRRVVRWATCGLIEDAAPLLKGWIKGALVGLGVGVAGAALSHVIDRELRFLALLLEKLFELHPVAAAGVLIGGALGAIWSCRNR